MVGGVLVGLNAGLRGVPGLAQGGHAARRPTGMGHYAAARSVDQVNRPQCRICARGLLHRLARGEDRHYQARLVLKRWPAR